LDVGGFDLRLRFKNPRPVEMGGTPKKPDAASNPSDKDPTKMGSPSAVCFFSGELPEVVVVWRILPSARSRSNTGQREDSAGWGVVSVLTRRGEWHESEGGL